MCLDFDSYIIEKTYSQLCTTIKCPNCNYKTSTYDPIQIIPLSITTNNENNNTIYDCLNEFTMVELLDTKNQWKCDQCNNYVLSKKCSQFWNLSDILIFQLKVYTKTTKVDTFITYPDILQMDKYNINYNNLSTHYKLFGLCIQFGSLNGGHYISICYNKHDNQWRLYNDSEVTSIPYQKVFEQKPYCLFYKRID